MITTFAIVLFVLVVGLTVALMRERRRRRAAMPVWHEADRLLDVLPQIVYEARADGVITYANRHAQAVLDMPADWRERGVTILDLIHEEDRQRSFEVLKKRLDGQDMGAQEYRLRMRDGSARLHAVYVAIQDTGGETTGVRGLAVDVSSHQQDAQLFQAAFDVAPSSMAILDLDHRYRLVNQRFLDTVGLREDEVIGKRPEEVGVITVEAAADLRERLDRDGQISEVIRLASGVEGLSHVVLAAARHELADGVFFVTATIDVSEEIAARQEVKRLATVVEQASEDVIITDLSGRIEYVNPAFTQLTGWQPHEVIGKTPAMLKSGEHDVEFYQELWSTITSGKTWTGQIINRSRSGERLVQEANISRVIDHEGNPVGYCSIKRDVTEQVHLERQVAQMQNLEAIGTMAGGIAHDFNNILVPILGYTELALEDAAGLESVCGALNKIQQAGERARELVRQILAFSREEIQEPQPLRIGPLTEEVLAFMRSTLPSTIRIQADIRSTLEVMADPTRIHQVIMNLCTNAGQAMRDEGGTLTVTVHDRPAGQVEVVVADTGCGMPVATVERVFEPFFTTRRERGGTGLGLSVVKSVVDGAGGQISVESQEGEGTRFVLRFPSIDSAPGAGEDRDRRTSLEGHERILFVDDEIVLCRLAVAGLQRLGYRVEAESSSELALARFEAAPHEVDAVVTDMTMPGLTGAQLAQRMLAIRPDLPILLCTGFSDQIDAEGATQLGIRAFAYKPLVTRDIAARLRTMLDGRPPGGA